MAFDDHVAGFFNVSFSTSPHIKRQHAQKRQLQLHAQKRSDRGLITLISQRLFSPVSAFTASANFPSLST